MESKTGEDGSYHTAQVGTGDRGRKKSKNVFDLIWIEIGLKKKFFQGMSSLAHSHCNGNHFSSYLL